MLLSLLLLALAPSAFQAAAAGPSLAGDWVTPDKSVVRIYNCGSALCMKIVYIDPAIGHTTENLNPDGAKRGQPLCDLVVGTGFQQTKPARAEGGKLYDPESGKTYSGTLSLEGATLRLHGYVGISVFGRTEEWKLAPAGHPNCRETAASSSQNSR